MLDARALRDMLHDLGSSVPSLPNNLCRNHIELFDSEAGEDVARCIEICSRCPARDPCARWAASQPPRRLVGVIAGHHYRFDRSSYEPTEHQRIHRSR